MYVDKSNDSAIRKVSYYLAALDDQFIVCDRTDEMIKKLNSRFPNPDLSDKPTELPK